MSAARFEPDKILIHNNAFTSVPLVHSRVMGGKLLILPNFLLHFKSKSTPMSSARFESDFILIHNKTFTSVPLVHSCVMVGKLLTLPNFLLTHSVFPCLVRERRYFIYTNGTSNTTLGTDHCGTVALKFI